MGRPLPHGEVGKPTSPVGIASPKAVPWRGGVRRQRAVGAGADYPGLLEGSCRDAIAALADLAADPYSVSEGAVFTDEPSGKLTLVYGVAHLYDPRDVHHALDEAIRVTRPGGVILTAFLSVHAILFNSYLNGCLLAGRKENFGDDGRIRHFEEQLFTGYNIAEFEALFAGKHVQHLITAAADSILELAEERCNFAMSDEKFPAFAAHHLATCEVRELLGCSSHLLHICRKE